MNAFSRGKATSGEPICKGITAFAKPANVGVANSSIMIVPWMVNNWLYCSLLTTCSPGRISSARISIASSPANRKKPNAVTRYRLPMTLWSVVLNHRSSTEP